MTYGNAYETEAVVIPNTWHHVMAVASNARGQDTNAYLYVDGIAVGAATGSYATSDLLLIVESNTGDDGTDPNQPDLGTQNFFNGVLDDLELFVMGTSTQTQTNYGIFNTGEDNDYIASELTGIDGDVNHAVDNNLKRTTCDRSRRNSCNMRARSPAFVKSRAS